ncbi:MAG: hypothetical protein ACK47C_03180 [Paracoccaceae bacterium]
MADEHQVSPKAEALFAAAVALVCAGAAIWLGLQLGWPGSFDVNDVDFVNPLSIMVLALVLGSLWFWVKALRGWLRHRAFGAATLSLDAPGFLRLGKPLSGRLRVQRPVSPTGPYKLTLVCHDVHEFAPDDNGPQYQSFPVWSASAELPATTDALKGLPFRFALPDSVGPDPVPSGIQPGVLRQSRTTIHVPGFRKVSATNHPPIDRHWKLTVTAPCKGPDFRAEIAVPLRD